MGNRGSKTKASPMHFTWKSPKEEVKFQLKSIEESSIISQTSSEVTQDYSLQDFEYDNAGSNELDSNESKFKHKQRRRRNKTENLIIKPYDPVQSENTLKPLQNIPKLSGQFDIAIDSQTQLIYATDYTNNCVQVFSSELEYQFHFPRWEVRPSSDILKCPSGITIVGNMVYVSECKRNEIAVFTLNGDYIGRIDKTFLKDNKMRMKNPTGLDSDSEGNIYVCDSLKSRILIFSEEIIPVCLELGKNRLVRPLAIQIKKNKIFVLDREPGQMAIKIFNKNGRLINKIRNNVKSGLLTVDKDNRILLTSFKDKTITILEEDGSCFKKINTNKKGVFSPLEHGLSFNQSRVIMTQENASGVNKLIWVNV